MNNKRVMSLFVLSFLVVALFGSLVFAQATYEQKVVNFRDNIGATFSPFLEPLFGNQQLLTRVFFALLLFMIIQPITSRMFGENKGFLSSVISFTITALALIALPKEFLDAILIQYGAMGAALLAAIPFVILLIFTTRMKSLLLARITWLFYVVYYIALFAFKVSSLSPPMPFFSEASIPYWAAIIAGIIIFFIIPTLRNWLFKGELEDKEQKALRGISFRNLGRKALNKETEGIVGSGV